jgi:hypothetical protein
LVVGWVVADVISAITITITITITNTIPIPIPIPIPTLQHLHTLAQMLAQELLHMTCNIDTDLIA